jgi:predicted nucleotidyltransferase component of viral defense system
VDFDFYTGTEFKAESLVSEIKKVATSLEVEVPDSNTLMGKINGVSVSFFEYDYPMVADFVDAGVNLASLSDIAAMKCIAVVQRGTKRDFVDMYFLNKMFGLPKIFSWVKRKYPMYDIYHVKTALMYFVEAEKDAMPKMLVDCNWEEVKVDLEKAVLSLDI